MNLRCVGLGGGGFCAGGGGGGLVRLGYGVLRTHSVAGRPACCARH